MLNLYVDFSLTICVYVCVLIMFYPMILHMYNIIVYHIAQRMSFGKENFGKFTIA